MSFGLKNGLRFNFDSVSCLNYPFFNFFQCRESQAKTQVVFQAKTLAKKVSIELPPCRLNYFETPSSLKFVMNTDVGSTQAVVRELLKDVYGQVYVEFALKNPMYVPGEAIASDLFTSKLDQVRSARNTGLPG